MAGQIISLISLPFLARLYTPSSFGQWSAILGVVSLASVIVHGRYHLAIPVTTNNRLAKGLLHLSLSLSGLSCLPVVLLVWLVSDPQIANETSSLCFAGAVLLCVITAWLDILAHWRSRCDAFALSGSLLLIRSFVTVVFQLLLDAFGTLGLLAGGLLGGLGALGVSLHGASKVTRCFEGRLPFQFLVQLARSHLQYPLFSAPQGIVAALAWNGLPLLLMRFDGAALAGQAWLAYRVLVAPLALLQAAYRHATLSYLKRTCPLQSRHQMGVDGGCLFGLGCFGAVLLWLSSEPLVLWALGSAWESTATVLAWLSVGVVGDLVKLPMQCLLQATAKQKRTLAWEVVILTSRYAGVIPLLVWGDAVASIAWFGFAGAVGWSIFVIVESGRF